MYHPSAEDLSDFLYGELPPARQAEVAAHVEACPACRERAGAWRDVRAALATWTLPERAAKPQSTVFRRLRWAAAASVLIASGFALARLTAPQPVAAVRADPAVVEALRAELKQDLSVQLAALHREYRDGVDRRIRQIEAERLAQYSGLRQDVETVALRTQEEFLRLTNAAAPATPADAIDRSH